MPKRKENSMALDFSLGISWQFGALAVLSMLLFPFFRGRYAFLMGAIGYSLVDIIPALLGASGTIGLWTVTGAITWGAVGILFTREKPSGSPLQFAKLGIGGTLMFLTWTQTSRLGSLRRHYSLSSFGKH